MVVVEFLELVIVVNNLLLNKFNFLINNILIVISVVCLVKYNIYNDFYFKDG